MIIGTRGSKLALVQTQLVIDALKKNYPALDIATKIITTKGDVNPAPIPLDTVGKSWFTEEIEQALLAREIDLAVHSLKDLPPQVPAGLVVRAVCERADPRDVLISKSGAGLGSLPHGAIIGTDSIRRKALLLAERQDLVVKSIRGNVDTRLKKLETEDYDAIVLAAAGLERIGLLPCVTEFLDPTKFIPAIGQGVLAAEARAGDSGGSAGGGILEMLKSIEHAPTSLAASAEQAFSRTVGGGCKLPVGCYARIEEGSGVDGVTGNAGAKVFLFAMMGDENGGQVARRSSEGPAENAVALAEALAKEILELMPNHAPSA